MAVQSPARPQQELALTEGKGIKIPLFAQELFLNLHQDDQMQIQIRLKRALEPEWLLYITKPFDFLQLLWSEFAWCLAPCHLLAL